MKKIFIGIVAISVMFISSIYISDYLFPYPPDHSVMWELRAEGDSIIADIEKYKLSNNTYPGSLSDAGIELPEAGYGGWQYALEDNGRSFSLSIGDYAEYLFVMGWDSASQQWWADR